MKRKDSYFSRSQKTAAETFHFWCSVTVRLLPEDKPAPFRLMETVDVQRCGFSIEKLKPSLEHIVSGA